MAYTRTAPNTFLPVAQGGTTVKQGIINDDTDIKYILSILSGLSTGKVPYRQTVLTGAVGSDGQPSFLVPSGLYVSIAAAAKSMLLSFAAGYGTDGYPVDYLSAVSADVANAWNLPPTQTVYLYIDRDASTGTLTYGYTTLEPSYATTKPTTPATGQAWYNPVLQYMQVYNGSSWDVRQRLYVAKGVTTDAATTLTYIGLTTDAIINQAVADLTAQYNAMSSIVNRDDTKTLAIPGATDGASPAQYLPYSKKLKEVRLLFRDAKFASVTASATTTIIVKKVVSGVTTTLATIAATVDTIYDVSPDATVEAGAYVYACFSGANNGVIVANVVLVWGA